MMTLGLDGLGSEIQKRELMVDSGVFVIIPNHMQLQFVHKD